MQDVTNDSHTHPLSLSQSRNPKSGVDDSGIKYWGGPVGSRWSLGVPETRSHRPGPPQKLTIELTRVLVGRRAATARSGRAARLARVTSPSEARRLAHLLGQHQRPSPSPSSDFSAPSDERCSASRRRDLPREGLRPRCALPPQRKTGKVKRSCRARLLVVPDTARPLALAPLAIWQTHLQCHRHLHHRSR